MLSIYIVVYKPIFFFNKFKIVSPTTFVGKEDLRDSYLLEPGAHKLQGKVIKKPTNK
jgi:hypothetical protein